MVGLGRALLLLLLLLLFSFNDTRKLRCVSCQRCEEACQLRLNSGNRDVVSADLGHPHPCYVRAGLISAAWHGSQPRAQTLWH
jgi:hypothetical protein